MQAAASSITSVQSSKPKHTPHPIQTGPPAQLWAEKGAPAEPSCLRMMHSTSKLTSSILQGSYFQRENTIAYLGYSTALGLPRVPGAQQ